MPITGGCHCGAIRYQAEGEALTHALCHCGDCRRHAGAPMVGWTMYRQEAVRVTRGTPRVYRSSEHGRRHFCPECGTGLFYINAEILPGIIDIQSATYDDPDAVPPRAHIQVAERIAWMERAHELPAFERYPAADVGQATPRWGSCIGLKRSTSMAATRTVRAHCAWRSPPLSATTDNP
jgi:hypothetical protein